MKELYYCDWCYKDYANQEGEVEQIYFSCYSNQQWASHLQTKKHIKNCLEVKTIEEGSKCIYCNKTFTTKGYEVHSKRNESLWKLQRCGAYKQLKCNNFFIGSKRYESFEQYLIDNDPNKAKQNRTKVGQISPITNQPRKKNGSTKQSISESSYESDQSEEEVDTPRKENLCERLNDGLHLTIEEIEVDEKPQFEDYCVACYKPINYEDLGISANILDKFDIITCFCSDSD